jgi:hypothetical protein
MAGMIGVSTRSMRVEVRFISLSCRVGRRIRRSGHLILRLVRLLTGDISPFQLGQTCLALR